MCQSCNCYSYKTETITDPVEHPYHYTQIPGVECIDVTQYHDFCTGNAIKYLWRAGLKKSAGKTDLEKEIEDLKKAIWYINKRIEFLEKGSENV